jgi:hypothetical protein
MRREKIQISNIRNAKGEITTHFMKPILLSSPNQRKTPPKRRTTGQFP